MLFFRQKKNKQTQKIYIPTWEEVVERCYDQELSFFSDQVIKVLYNSAKSYRVVILMRNDGNYRIIEEELIACDEDDLIYHQDIWGYWSRIDRYVSIFDSLESAEEEALRLIVN